MTGARLESMPTTTPATTETMNPLNSMTFFSMALLSLRRVHLSNIEESFSAPLLASDELILARAAMNRSSSPDELVSFMRPANALSTGVPSRILLTASRSATSFEPEKTPTNEAASPRPLDERLSTVRSLLITSSSPAVVADSGGWLKAWRSPPCDVPPGDREREVEHDDLEDDQGAYRGQTRPLGHRREEHQHDWEEEGDGDEERELRLLVEPARVQHPVQLVAALLDPRPVHPHD